MPPIVCGSDSVAGLYRRTPLRPKKRRDCAAASDANLHLHRTCLVRTRYHDPGIVAGKAGSLFLERCHWETRAWLDDHPLGVKNSLSTPHIYELGIVGEPGFNRRASELFPGPRRLTVRVDNRTKVDVGHSSATTAEVGATWNGIIGRMELQTTDPVWIDRLSAYPHPGGKAGSCEACPCATLTGKRYSGKLEIASGNTKNQADRGFRTQPQMWLFLKCLFPQLSTISIWARPSGVGRFLTRDFRACGFAFLRKRGNAVPERMLDTTFGLREALYFGQTIAIEWKAHRASWDGG